MYTLELFTLDVSKLYLTKYYLNKMSYLPLSIFTHIYHAVNLGSRNPHILELISLSDVKRKVDIDFIIIMAAVIVSSPRPPARYAGTPGWSFFFLFYSNLSIYI